MSVVVVGERKKGQGRMNVNVRIGRSRQTERWTSVVTRACGVALVVIGWAACSSPMGGDAGGGDSIASDGHAEAAADGVNADVGPDARGDVTGDVTGDATGDVSVDAAFDTMADAGGDSRADVGSSDATFDVPDSLAEDVAAADAVDAPPPVDAGPPLTGIVDLALGIDATCARMMDDTVRCWGGNREAQVGDGTTTRRLLPVATVDTSGMGRLTGVSSIAAAYSRRACAVLAGGTVACWGNRTIPPVPKGSGPVLDRVPTVIAGLSNVTQVATGNQFVCARIADGTVQCWGVNGYGQLGDGTTASRATPAPVLVAAGGAPLGNVAQVAVGHHFACARMNDGTVRCWGSHQAGQLGDGRPASVSAQRSSPAAVLGITNAVEIAAGHWHACARLMDNTVRCWGQNGSGQLGDGTTTTRTMPVIVGGLTNVVQLAVEGDGFNGMTCARLADGTARCWGQNHQGQLGDGTTAMRSTPVTVTNSDGTGALSNIARIAVGGSHACAVLTSGQALCWGWNGEGQIGDGTMSRGVRPTLVRN